MIPFRESLIFVLITYLNAVGLFFVVRDVIRVKHFSFQKKIIRKRNANERYILSFYKINARYSLSWAESYVVRAWLFVSEEK